MTTFITDQKALKTPKMFTLGEYLAREEKAINKHEFYNGQIVRMPGGKFSHNEIASNMLNALRIAVKPLPKKYRVINSDQKIYIAAENKALYPDALVVCERPEFWEDREDLIVNPLLIVEVASKSTRMYDRGEKFMLYRSLPTFKEYVLIEQNLPSVEAWFKEKETTWDVLTETALNNAILLRSLGVSILLADIYENIEFI